MNLNRNLTIILATSKSKRIKHKNIVDVCGKPMLAYIIDIARHSNTDEIAVSTDGDEVIEIAKKYGVEVVEREHNWNQGFGVTANNLMEKSIEKYQLQSGKSDFSNCTILFGNAMFIRPSWIRAARYILTKRWHMGNPISHIYPRDATGVLCFRLGNIAHHNSLYMQHFGLNIDIDYPEDLKLARSVMHCIQKGEIDYSLNETIHENEEYIMRAIERDIYVPLARGLP